MDQAVHLAVQALGQQRDARDLDAAGGRPGARTREHQRRQHDLTRCGPEGEVLRGIAGGADDGDDLKGGVGERLGEAEVAVGAEVETDEDRRADDDDRIDPQLLAVQYLAQPPAQQQKQQ